MTDNPGQAPAGWYPDPAGTSRQRYFDGEKWTEHYHDPAAPAAPVSDASRETIIGGAPLQAAQPYASQAGAPQGAPQPVAYASAPMATNMGPLDYWKVAMLEKYADFSGRARRAEYWGTWLINVVGIGILYGIVFAVSTTLALVLILVYLAILVPGIAVAIRRLHDTNKSGWWLLLGLIPLGGLVLLFFMVTDGDRGPNQYGPSPKY